MESLSDVVDGPVRGERPHRAVVVPLWILAVVAALFFLREAKSLLIPIALAVLVSYALAPVVSWLVRHRVPRMAGAGLVLLLLLAASAGGTYAIRSDVQEMVNALPQAVERTRGMVGSWLEAGGTSLAEVAGGQIGGETPAGDDPAAETGNSMNGSMLQRSVEAILALGGHLTVVLFLTYFLLIAGHHVQERLVEIAGPDPGDRQTASAIIDDITAQIQRYLLVLLVTATIVGLATWLVLAWMGVRNAATLGFVAGVLNSIPYFGPVIVSGVLFVVGLMQGGGVISALQLSATTMVITSLEGWLLTPPLMGKAERMSALAVFLGLLLWTWIWGAWGTVLAVPMLAVIKSVADHVRPLRPIGRLLAP